MGADEKRSTTAGSSDRTPCKHRLMSRLIGREVGVLSTPRFAQVPGACWGDMTAGDGVAANGGEWIKNCSPGILAHRLLPGSPEASEGPRDLRTDG